MSVPQCTRGQKSGTKQETATVCLLFICLKITVQWEAACGCWRVLPPWNASGGFGGLLGLLFLNRSRRVLGEPRNKWQDLISKNVFSCCFLCCPFPAGQEDIAADWPAGPHAVSCQILQTKEIRTRESPRAGWAFVTVGTDPFENVLPWFWDQSTELGDQRKPPPYQSFLVSQKPKLYVVAEKKIQQLWGFIEINHTHHTQVITSSTWLSPWLQDQTPKHAVPYCFAVTAGFASYFWATGRKKIKENPSYKKQRFIWTKVKPFKFQRW